MRFVRAAARVVGAVLAMALCVLAPAACAGKAQPQGRNADGTITITLAGWTLATRPEFRALADAYHAQHPDVTVQVKEYSADDYDKQLIADLSAGSSTDVFPIKNLRMFYTYAHPGALADLSDVAAPYVGDHDLRGLESYRLDGSIYAMPYRQDVWVLFYNRTMLAALGIDEPDGAWTWDEYERQCGQIGEALKARGDQGVYATYHHTAWQSMLQGIALAQRRGNPDSTFFSGDYSYLEPVYERMVRMEDEGLTLPYNTVSSSKTTYQSQFGTQKAVLLPMATWYMGPLAQAQQDGDADRFEWGIVPLPQRSKADVAHPKSFGDPTGFAVSSRLSGERLAVAKDFVAWASGEQGAMALAKTGALPAYWSDDVLDVFLDHPYMPDDEQTRTAIVSDTVVEENPVGAATQVIQDELQIAHTSILSRTRTPQDALRRASNAVKSSGLLD
ncbi:ABC transporter, solute-binding protein [Bifidobacterium pseudolongum subsp. globosum]|uniref:ABC transporter substrate-binding protein n=1 Tax=Bifidobacterium pseudolongum TaxID=1694 RepID=UPI001021C95A|nr:extracellular solute-binding protein [Bifidobacterium pseudolongum]RYQ35153.1 ABC transporter, solute-binding protein [Bifidobacterium pseudolongum subsp. globosum]